MELAAIGTAFDNAVIGTGGNQQTDGADEEPQPNPVGVAGILRELTESVVEDSTKPEPQQDLSPEDQDSGFVECGLDLYPITPWANIRALDVFGLKQLLLPSISI